MNERKGVKVILRADVEKLGSSGDVVNVSDGYARNYLLPRKLALQATKANLAVYKEEKTQKKVGQSKELRLADLLAKDLEQVSCTAVVSVGEDDRVFGSVTTHAIADLLKEKGYDIDRRKIILEEPIRALGVYTVPIKLHTDVEGRVKVWVVKE